MQEQLISFPTAKLAKEKGFDLPTLYGYNSKQQLQEYYTYASYSPGEPEIRIEDFLCNWEYQVPTQSFLQKWLRNVHNIEIVIEPIYGENEYSYAIYLAKNHDHKWECEIYDTEDSYEKSLEVALIEALKLIK